jgi:hypothetical protein
MPVSVLSLEFLVHAWDFARSTGRDAAVTEPVSDYALELAGNVLDPTRDYQPRGVKCGNSPENRLHM